MEEDLYFNKLVTKALHPIADDSRFFEGYLTVQVKDKQGEITVVDELIKVLPIWMDRGAPISDTHSNRIIGKGISYAQTVYKDTNGEEYPAIKITGKIHKNYELDNEIWSKIKSGEYKGLSFGGATKSNRTPKVMKDGSVAYELSNLEHYEVAVCKDPAVPLALITDYNPIAKAMTDNIEDRDGKMLIKCDKFGCFIDKYSLGGEQMHAQGQRGLGHDHTYNQNTGVGTGIQTTEVKDTNEEENSERDSEGKQDAENDGVNHSMFNQDVDEDASSGRKKSTEEEKFFFTSKSGYQTEDGNNQLGGQGKADEEAYKSSEIYINSKKQRSGKNMAEEESKKETFEEAKDEEEESQEEVEKSFQETVNKNMETLTDVIQSLAETQKSVENTLGGIDNRLKALETPTDLPLKPATSAEEDVGAKVKVPDEYQSNSRQTGLDSDRSPNDGEKSPKSDNGNLKMQEKTEHSFSTETPRPSAAQDVNKNFSEDYSPILKDARSEGYEGLANVARNILKGTYYTPSNDEVGQF
jgi:hypothetical protein|tara:strand:+ start:7042 stop:8616 length:1575 start_codon:yes stop_codon:yes gene_type:complete